MSKYLLYHGECQEVLPRFAKEFVDSVVCDPLYGLNFMGSDWDRIPEVGTWKEIHDSLKPGGWLAAFASPRTYHIMVTRIQEAGFEIRDMISWLYAQGMPKSGTLKPAQEPIVLARKLPASNKLNVESCRLESGRYPSNLIHDGSPTVKAMFPNNNPGCKPHRVKASVDSVQRLQQKGWGFSGTDKFVGYDDGDDLSAGRFFYCAKPSKAERDAGTVSGNNHLTVKPVQLMRYLCRLLTPKHGLVLDPFMGSGTTGVAALLEGFTFIGIDSVKENVELANQRIYHVDVEHD